MSISLLASAEVRASASVSASFSTLVAFGGVEVSADSMQAAGASRVIKGASLAGSDLQQLYSAPDGDVVAMVASKDLPLSQRDTETLQRLMLTKIPVFIRMNGQSSVDRQRVAMLLGVAPKGESALVHRDTSGDMMVFLPSTTEAASDGAILRDLRAARAMQVEAEADAPAAPVKKSVRTARSMSAVASVNSVTTPPEISFAPIRRYKLFPVSKENGIGGGTTIEVARAVTQVGDRKIITVTSDMDITPPYVGYYRTPETIYNQFALPTNYGATHQVSYTPPEGGEELLRNLDYLPKSDGRTDFDFNDTSTVTTTFGGTAGAEVSSSGKPDEALAAKASVQASASYTKTRTRALSMKFTDYSLQASSAELGRVSWKAPIASRAYHNVLNGNGGGLWWRRYHTSHHVVSAMTPMMRSAHLAGESTWSVPGASDGNVTVTVKVAFERAEYRSPSTRLLRHVNKEAVASIEIPMEDPYLTREMTVLISSWEDGRCLAGVEGRAELLACNKADRRQMWSLDTNDRYVNFASKTCLTATRGNQPVSLQPCVLNGNNQRWRWLADRLHLYRGGTRGDRLFVKNGELHSSVPSPGIESFPVNSHHPLLPPYPSYPSPPFPGELVPAPSHVASPTRVDPSVVNLPPVDDRQRWDVQVLRSGL
ncbi:hypothetical protein FHW69_003613 [Luteibacter sp. Sphag1AF]|uniref:RICIN domain-containing protein n=1 Tax=Luteibacter sp. Sphag1AF TaxID=2587031 RepID=UPI00160BF084|nr:RICIN domain-containing protein [Luteibacter sp. Sphag1AF]MBB3228965.1 hypothetical protein [Luteibacter sp. Sphag1AF]